MATGTAFLLAGVCLPAAADAWTAPNPHSNFPIGTLPDSCWTAPNGTQCVDAGISYLDQARAKMGQPAYVLPKNFDSLAPAVQAFILTNLDRILYGLPPVQGLTGGLNRDAAGGVHSDNDPTPSDSNWWGYTSNWAGGYENMLLAYGGWMYDDGPGSGNLDCTAKNSSGCWGHRQDILWKFGPGGPVAMGAAAGNDPSGTPGYAMLLEQGGSGWKPAYVYTWAQAVAAGAKATTLPGFRSTGAGGSHGSPAKTASASKLRIDRVQLHGHRASITISAPHVSQAACLLRRLGRHGWYTFHSIHCSQRVTFNHLPGGRYRLRVKSSVGTQTRRIRVR